MAYHSTAIVREQSELLEDTGIFPDADLNAMELNTVRPLMNVKLARFFTVDLATVPDVITTIASILVAGYCLRSKLSAEDPNENDIATALIDQGWSSLADVLETPGVLGIPLKTVTDTDLARNRVKYASPRSGPVFTYPDDLLEPDDTRGL